MIGYVIEEVKTLAGTGVEEKRILAVTNNMSSALEYTEEVNRITPDAIKSLGVSFNITPTSCI